VLALARRASGFPPVHYEDPQRAGGRRGDAFEVAHELLGGLPLTTGQLTQLRAIDRKYWQAVFTLLHPNGEEARPTAAGVAAATPSLTAEQTTELHAMLVREVRGLVRPEQRGALGWP
jgi:hypothetical protein